MNRRLTAVAVSSLACLTLSACSTDSTDAAQSSSDSTGYPVRLDNCGAKVTVDAQPRKIVSLNQGSTEILLSLGVADRMVGTGTWTDPVLASLAEANAKVPRLADNAPSVEAVLGTEPDLVTASFTSTLAQGGVAPRERFTDLGVPTYLSPADCEGKVATGEDGARETPLGADLIYKEITELGRIVGATDRADALVGELKGKLTDAQAKVTTKGTTAMFWFANSESPYVAGCCGAPGLISNALGLKNVFDDTKDEWPQINWEVVAQRNPQVLVLGDLTRKSQTAESGQAKIAFLESNPVTREMDAVKNKRYILATGAEMNPSLRTFYGVENVADGLVRLGLAGR